MFRLDNYMEEWAARYALIGHTEKEPHFFRCNDEMLLDEFLQNYQQLQGFVCGIKTNLEGTLNIIKNIDIPIYTCLFLGHAEETDFREQANVKYRCKQIAKSFLISLRSYMKNIERESTGNATKKIDLENVAYDMIGPVTNGWFGLVLTLTGMEYVKECFTPSDYLS